MSLPRIVCLSGRAGVGKDTLADHLVDQYGFVKMSLADPIKQLLNQRFGWTMDDWQNRVWKELPQVHVPDMDVWVSPRQLAQWLGTEVGRHLAGPDVWVKALWKDYCTKHSPRPLVIPDVRFDNEAQFFRDLGAKVVLIERSEVEAVAQHVSENGLREDLWDFKVVNVAGIDHFIHTAVCGLEADL